MNQLQLYPSNDFKLSFHNGFIPPQNLSQPNKRVESPQVDTQQPKQYKQRGINGLRGEAKRRIRSGCAILEQVYTKKCLSFLTCTVPVKGHKATAFINKYWGEITGKFFKELKRLLERRGLPENYVYVTELQEQRLDKSGEVAPHLHIVFVGRNHPREHWAISPTEIRELWNRIIRNHYPRPFDESASTRIEQIKFSVRNYLTKYMTKHTSCLAKVKEMGLSEQLPKQWWYTSRGLGNAITASIKGLSVAETIYIEKNLERFKQCGHIRWYFRIEEEFTESDTGFTRKVCFGIVGCFSDDGLDKIKALFQRECPVNPLKGYYASQTT